MIRLTDPIQIGEMRVRNRLYRAPVLEGAGKAKDPAKVYARHFVANAKGGVGLIVQGNKTIVPEGRTSPGMTCVSDMASMLAMKPMVDQVKAEGASIVCQLGHGGIYSLASWHTDHRATLPWAVSKPPLWLRVAHRGVHVLSTDEVQDMIERVGLVAGWAREAGYDGVQLAGANAKLYHQFLSSTYNRRTDRFGGSIEGRANILRAVRASIGRHAGEDYPVLLKYTALEVGRPGGGISLEEGVEIARIAEDAGYAAVTPAACAALPDSSLSRGDFPGRSFENPRLAQALREAHHTRLSYWLVRLGFRTGTWKYPYEPVWNQAVFSAVKAAVDIPVFAVGGIRTPTQAARILASEHADMIGVGRPFYAEPQLAEWFLDDSSEQTTACANCNRCIVPQMLGMPGVCYNPASNKAKTRRNREPVAMAG